MASRPSARACAAMLLGLGAAVAACDGGSGTGASGPEPTGTTSAAGGGGAGGATGGTGGTGATGGAGGTSSGGGGSGGTTSSTTNEGGSGAACSAFAQRYGGADPTAEDRVGGAAVTPDGGAIVAGELSGTMAVGAEVLASAGGTDALVVRLKEGGGVAWAKRFGSVYDDRVRGVAALADGGAVIVGTFDGAVDFGGTVLTSIAGPDAFVARLGAGGELVFAHQYVNADARAVAIDEAGNILVAGDFVGMSSFGDISLVSAQNDLFVTRVSPAGAVTAAVHFVSTAKPGAVAIAAGAGRTYVAGSFQGTLDFGAAGALASAGSRDVFLARLDGALGAVLARRFGDGTSQEAHALAVLSDGGAAIAGAFRGTLDFDGMALVADTQDDGFVARVDEDGSTVFARRFGDVPVQQALAIAADGGGGLLVGGGFEGTIDLGDGPVVSAGGADAFLVRLDPQGAAVKTERWGGALDQRVRAVSADPCGAVLVAGEMLGTMSFGDVTLDAPGVDVFVGRVAP